ncbi:MAG: redoxin domain-containing protein [Phycisphaerales bacterium]
MYDKGVRLGVIGLAVLAVTSQASRGQDHFEERIKTVTVVDANGVPVPDARVYTGECLVWDNRAQTVRLTEQPPRYRTDANGVFSFEFARQGADGICFTTDASFERMGCLYIARGDPAETYTLRLEKLARIKGIVQSDKAMFSDVHVRLYYDAPKAQYPLFSADCHLDTPVHEMTLDILCPAGRDLNLCVEPQESFFDKYQEHREIVALKPGQVFNVHWFMLEPISGFKAFGRPAPELQVAEWVKGEPVTLAELRGKVVLLHFWGVWCGKSRDALSRLAKLHEKCGRDGLVTISKQCFWPITIRRSPLKGATDGTTETEDQATSHDLAGQ